MSKTKTTFTKRFRIGEYAIGGIIEATVETNGKVVLRALNWSDDSEVRRCEFSASEWLKIDSCLNIWTSYYYAQQIMTWLRNKCRTNKNITA